VFISHAPLPKRFNFAASIFQNRECHNIYIYYTDILCVCVYVFMNVWMSGTCNSCPRRLTQDEVPWCEQWAWEKSENFYCICNGPIVAIVFPVLPSFWLQSSFQTCLRRNKLCFWLIVKVCMSNRNITTCILLCQLFTNTLSFTSPTCFAFGLMRTIGIFAGSAKDISLWEAWRISKNRRRKKGSGLGALELGFYWVLTTIPMCSISV